MKVMVFEEIVKVMKVMIFELFINSIIFFIDHSFDRCQPVRGRQGELSIDPVSSSSHSPHSVAGGGVVHRDIAASFEPVGDGAAIAPVAQPIGETHAAASLSYDGVNRQ